MEIQTDPIDEDDFRGIPTENKEFNLSKLRTSDIISDWVYEEKDVKEFIRLRNKEETEFLDKFFIGLKYIQDEDIIPLLKEVHKRIEEIKKNKLAGKELI